MYRIHTIEIQPKPDEAGYPRAYPARTVTVECDGCSIAPHADDVHQVT